MPHLSLSVRFFSARFFSVRRRSTPLAAALGVLLAASSLTLPQRSAGQDPQYSPSSASDPSGGNPPYDAGTGSNDNGDNAAGSASNPPVGVDTNGHPDAVATRNGRTTRPRVPAAPANPLVLTDPTRSPEPSGTYGPDSPYGPNSAYGPDSAQSNRQNNSQSPLYYPQTPPAPTGNRLIPPVVTRDPGNYTIQTDPSLLGQPRLRKPLPLFGYDFFQPARQIIVARRRALLPPPPRVIRYPQPSRPGQPRTPGQQSPSGNNGYNSSGYNYYNDPNAAALNSSYPNGSYPNGSYQNSGGYNDNSNGADAALLGGVAYGAAGQRGGSAQYDVSGGDLSQSGGQEQTNPQAGQYPNSQYPSQYPTGSPRSNGYSNPSSDPNSAGFDPNIPGTGADGNALNGDVTSTTILRPSPNTGYDYQNGDGTQNGGTYQNQNSYQTGSGFPGDTAPLGSDIQFPGDDALLQNGTANNGTANNGTANAVVGQVTDPISSTLYRNVLASLPPNYQLQPGDQLTVRYSALALAPREFTATVDLQGGVEVEGVGRISVAGRTASQAEDTLRLRLSRLYRNVDVSINLRQLRTIQVTVSGAAFAPGTYTVPATATAFNVLNAAGGPTADGSLRDIRVLRNGRLAGTLDIYPLIGATSANPRTKSSDISLQAGDNIYIPARLSRIAIVGEVRQQAVYELTSAESLRDALRYAGGVKPSGVDQNVHIDTINNGTDRVIVDVNLRDRVAVAKTSVYDGDTIEVSSIRSIITNRVTINGAVNQQGDYALTPGLTVKALISRAGGLLYDTYANRADLFRLNPDNTTTRLHLDIGEALNGDPAQNIPLKRFDILQLYTRQEVSYIGRRLVTVRGAVQRPGFYTQSDNMRVSDLLLDSGGPLPDAYLSRAVLLHQRGDGTYAYNYVSLREIMSGDTSMDLPIQDNDVLAIYRNGEAHFTPDHTVKILGNVVAPGLYARGEGMRLSDLLKVVGAFKPGGGTRVTVAHARRPVTDKAIQIASAIIPSQTVDYTPEQTVASGTNLTLQDGDVIAVQGDGNLQDHPAVVTVTGMVNRPGPIIIQQGMHLSDAIKQAGGLRLQAFPQGAEFTRMSDALATPGQLDLATVIARMSDMLNLSQLQREKAKSNLELIQAAGTAASGSSSSIAGLGGGSANAANPNLAPLTNALSQNSLVSPARLLTLSQLEPNGAVAVQLAQALKRPGSIDDVLLKDGDTLVVPETPTTVQVVGAVYSGRGVVYRPGQSIDYYVRLVGGFTPDAATDRIEVIHAGGGLIPADKAGALQPGDLILIPTKVLAEKISRSGSGFSEFFQGLLGGAITLKVLSSVFGL